MNQHNPHAGGVVRCAIDLALLRRCELLGTLIQNCQRPPRHSACQAPLSQHIFRFKKVFDLYTSELPPMVPSPSRVPSSRECRGTSVHAHTRSSSSFVPSSCAIVAARSSLCCVVGCRAKQTKQSKLVRSFVRVFVRVFVRSFVRLLVSSLVVNQPVRVSESE